MEIRDVLLIAEFSGKYPDVPLAEGVDYDALVTGDSDPFFVTLPVAEVDAISGNNRHYDGVFVRELARQILEKRPVGNMGHLPDDQRSTAFPMPASHWVGMKLEGKTLWGKAYVPPGEVREFVRRMKATQSKIATSIYGTGDQSWNAERGAYSVKNFNLESIDFAPAERAGVGSLAAVPLVTKETKQMSEQNQAPPINRVQVIGEMSVEEVRYLPEGVRTAILQQSPDAKLVSELAKVTGKEGDAILALVRELVQERAALHTERINGAINQAVAEAIMPNAVQVTERVKAARAMVGELVRAKAPQDEASVKAAIAEIAERAEVKLMVEAATIAEMGPNAGKQTQTTAGDGWKRHVIIPETK